VSEAEHPQLERGRPSPRVSLLLGADAGAALAVPAFRRMFAAASVFNLGHFVQSVAMSWYMFELTGSPFWVGLMVAAPQLPFLLLSLPAGALADLVDRKRVLQYSTAVMIAASGTMSVLWFLGALTPGLLITLGLILGIGSTAYNPAWNALVPRLLPMPLLPAGIGLNATLNGITAAVGPALGGLLVAAVGAGPSFGVGALGYGAILIAVTALSAPASTGGSSTIGMAIGTGMRYLRFSPTYRSLLLFGALFAFTSASFRPLLPNLTSDVLLGSAELYGWLLGCFGLGAAIGGMTRNRAEVRLKRLIPAACLLFGTASALLGLATRAWVAAVALLLIGIGWTWVVATLNTVFQLLTPSWVLGRAMSAYVLSVFGVLPIGAFAAGALASQVGTAATQVFFGSLVVLLGLLSLRMPLPQAGGISPPVMPDGELEHVQTVVGAAPVMVTTTWEVEEEEFEKFLEVLGQIRRIRLATGAYAWSVYRSAHDARRITEAFMVHSWEEHLLQHRRLDTRGLDTVLRAEDFGTTVVTDHLIAFDVDDPQVRPRWEDQVPIHEQMHHGRRARPVSNPGPEPEVVPTSSPPTGFDTTPPPD